MSLVRRVIAVLFSSSDFAFAPRVRLVSVYVDIFFSLLVFGTVYTELVPSQLSGSEVFFCRPLKIQCKFLGYMTI